MCAKVLLVTKQIQIGSAAADICMQGDDTRMGSRLIDRIQKRRAVTVLAGSTRPGFNLDRPDVSQAVHLMVQTCTAKAKVGRPLQGNNRVNAVALLPVSLFGSGDPPTHTLLNLALQHWPGLPQGELHPCPKFPHCRLAAGKWSAKLLYGVRAFGPSPIQPRRLAFRTICLLDSHNTRRLVFRGFVCSPERAQT